MSSEVQGLCSSSGAAALLNSLPAHGKGILGGNSHSVFKYIVDSQ